VSAVAIPCKRLRSELENLLSDDSDEEQKTPLRRVEQSASELWDTLRAPTHQMTSLAQVTPWSTLSLFSE